MQEERNKESKQQICITICILQILIFNHIHLIHKFNENIMGTNYQKENIPKFSEITCFRHLKPFPSWDISLGSKVNLHFLLIRTML